ncbi:MAG: histidine phosphatase family protein [Gammaproteobacteria bacterium]|jgi:phosphohistidine phosphatase
MPRKLILFRHAKSDWDSGASSDHARPLAKRGIKAAKRMGRFLREAGEVPEHILCSSAVRAVSTVQLAARSGGWIVPIDFRDTLYLPDTETLIREIRNAPDALSSLMLVGHEPSWSELISELIGGGEIRFPTAAMARINLDVDSWDRVRPDHGELAWLVKPKLLGQGS